MLTLILHALILGGIYVARPLAPRPVEARYAAPIDFVFTPKPISEPKQAPDADQPTAFTELPPDREDQAPDHADLLSNITSRARQENASEKDTGMPRMTGASDFPHVALSPGGGAARSEEHRPPEQGARLTEKDLTPQTNADGIPTEDPRGTAADKDPNIRRSELSPPTASLDPDKLRLLSPLANYDILQDAMYNPDGGVFLPGGISLNTLAWPYAPWLQRFTRDFLSRWSAPYAYRMGMIHGSHVLELEIATDGRLLRMDLLQQEGDIVLVQTSELTFRTMAPYQPLPADFPEKTLILRIRLVYPDLRQDLRQLQERRQVQAPERPFRRGGRP